MVDVDAAEPTVPPRRGLGRLSRRGRLTVLVVARPDGARWTFWQCSDVAEVDGIDGGVDLNVRR